MRFIKGFSLLEILIALALGLLLLLCLFQVYASIKSLSAAIAKNTKFQSNARFVTHFLRRSIGAAGYAGCGQLKNIDLKNNTDFAFTAETIIHGFSSDNLPGELAQYQVAPNTDVIVVKRADDSATSIEKNIKTGAKKFYAALDFPISKTNQTLLIADCLNADLVTALSIKDNLISLRDKIAHKYSHNSATVGRFTEIAYFISASSKSGRQKGAAPIYGLFYAVNYGEKVLLGDNINLMQIRYGVGLKDGAAVDSYYTAGQIEAKKLWGKVNSVIVTLTQQGAEYKTRSWDVYIKLRERAL